MKPIFIASAIAIVALVFSSGAPAMAYLGGGGGQYLSSTNCNGVSQYASNYRFITPFSTTSSQGPNTFGIQLNVGIANAKTNWQWMQLIVDSNSGTNTFSIQETSFNGGATSILASTTFSFWYTTQGSSSTILTMTSSGNYMFGALTVENSAYQTVYTHTFTINLGYHATLYSAYTGLYGGASYQTATFYYPNSGSGARLATANLVSSSSSGNVFAWNQGYCGSSRANLMTGEISNLNYVSVSESSQTLYFALATSTS